MKRVLLDTNIYEFILKYMSKEQIEELKKSLVIYGNEIVRKELRAIGKKKKIATGKGVRSLRIVLLTLYDVLTEKHHYRITEEMLALAGKYFVAYRSFSGIKSEEEMQNDLVIVACASLKGLDIVVSEDNRTMRGREATLAYALVNGLESIATPTFIGFRELKRVLGGVKLD